MASVFGFPSRVNDVAARAVATGVFVIAVAAAASGQLWLTIPLAYGFVARVLAGPRFSPLALVATRLVAPRFERSATFSPGPPKRFAQAMGAAFSLSALGLFLAGEATPARVVLAVLAVPAALEAGLGFCLGCQIFALGMRLGIVPESVCVECADIWGRRARAARS